MHASTHCLKSFGLYDGKRLVAHLLVVPVTSPSGEQEAIRTVRTIRPATRTMKPPTRKLPSRQVGSICGIPWAAGSAVEAPLYRIMDPDYPSRILIMRHA